MRRTLVLRYEPTVHQIGKIISRIQAKLVAHGAIVEPEGRGELRFRMPAPWRAWKSGLLLAITKGDVRVSAGAGGPWRVRYELRYTRLTALAIGLTVILVALGIGWRRIDLLNAMLLLWGVGYGALYLASGWGFHRILRAALSDAGVRSSTRSLPAVNEHGEATHPH